MKRSARSTTGIEEAGRWSPPCSTNRRPSSPPWIGGGSPQCLPPRRRHELSAAWSRWCSIRRPPEPARAEALRLVGIWSKPPRSTNRSVAWPRCPSAIRRNARRACAHASPPAQARWQFAEPALALVAQDKLDLSGWTMRPLRSGHECRPAGRGAVRGAGTLRRAQAGGTSTQLLGELGEGQGRRPGDRGDQAARRQASRRSRWRP